MLTEKRCTKCGEIKPIDQFRKKSGYRDGVSWCKKCEVEYTKEYQQTEAGKKTVARYYERNADKIKERYRQYEKTKNARKRASRYNCSDKGKAYHKKARKLHPEKYNARQAVNCAIKRGELQAANTFICYFDGCTKQAQEYHHYLGYDEEHWLDVEPYCIQHHRDIDNGDRED
jgi:hypothetical protein